ANGGGIEAVPVVPNNSTAVAASTPSPTNRVASAKKLTPTGPVAWFDDSAPTNAQLYADGGDSWAGGSNKPPPYSGQTAHQSTMGSGMHQHYFDWAANTMYVTPGNILFTYVYLDPSNMPSEIMLEWNDGTWNHRAYWGGNSINSGTNG